MRKFITTILAAAALAAVPTEAVADSKPSATCTGTVCYRSDTTASVYYKESLAYVVGYVSRGGQPYSQQTVYLQRRHGAHNWKSVAEQATDRTGMVMFVLQDAATYRLRYLGDDTTQASSSQAFTP